MICQNPYCPNPAGGTRSPTTDEMRRFRNELEKEASQFSNQSELRKRLLSILDKLDKNEIALQICTMCSTWPGETYDSRKGKIQQVIASPFKFNLGDRVKVTLEGNHCSMIGVVTKRIRLCKLIMPPPTPENVYYVVFEGNSKDYGYGEAHLIRV